MRGEQGHPRFARADALLTLLKVHSSVKKADAVTPLEPFFAGLKNVLTSDPLGSTMATLFAKVPAMPDPLLAGARDIEGGRYGEGHTDRAGGLDAGLSVARFGPCIMQGAGEVAGAYAQGVRIAPTGLDLGAAGAEVCLAVPMFLSSSFSCRAFHAVTRELTVPCARADSAQGNRHKPAHHRGPPQGTARPLVLLPMPALG